MDSNFDSSRSIPQTLFVCSLRQAVSNRPLALNLLTALPAGVECFQPLNEQPNGRLSARARRLDSCLDPAFIPTPMAKHDDIMIKQNTSSYRGLVGEAINSHRSLSTAEIDRLPPGSELTLELDNTTPMALLLPAVQKVRDAASRASTIQLKLDQVDSLFVKLVPTTVTQKVLGSGRQGYSIKLRKS